MALTIAIRSRIAFALFVWITPALIAGALGWPSLWGNSSALVDYLLPLPLTGGVIHVPSFAVFVALLIAADKRPQHLTGVPVAAFAVCTLALALQLNLEHVNDVLFTDLHATQRLVFDRDPLWLFIANDGFWLGVWTLAKRIGAPRIAWLTVPMMPVFVIAASATRYVAAPAQFAAGVLSASDVAGQQQQLVYTNIEYDESLLRAWLEETPRMRPWLTPDAQHVAIHFVRSRQRVANKDFTDLRSLQTTGTICLYEEDQSIRTHPGYFDCFARHLTLTQRLAKALDTAPAGSNRDFAKWYSRVAVCEGLALQKAPADNIEHVDHCLAMRRTFTQDVLAVKKQYGRRSREARLAQALGKRTGFGDRK